MANELGIQVGTSFTKGTGNAQVKHDRSYTVQRDVTGSNPHETVQTIGTVAEAISIGDVATTGYVLLRNLDPTNFVTISTDAAAHANPVVKLLAGDVALFRANAALYGRADTAACAVRVTVHPT